MIEVTERRAAPRVDHRELLAEGPVTRPFDAACRELLPAPLRYRDLIQLFSGRASRAAIHAWRFGTRQPPQWAIDILREQARERCKRIAARVDCLQPGPGMGWNKNATRGIGEWRARQNLRRDVPGS